MSRKRCFLNESFTISQEEVKYAWTMPYEHFHAAYEIYILTSGERTVTIDGAEYEAKAMDATLFPSGIPHKSRGSVPFSGICIHFSDIYLNLYFTAAAKEQLMQCFNYRVISLDADSFKAVQEIADNFDHHTPDSFLTLASVLNILNHTRNQKLKSAESDNAAHTADAEALAQNGGHVKKSEKIIGYVNENYTYIKTISDITELFDVSENYVFKVFRKNYGMTPKQYINSLRINNACHRLNYGNKTIKSIAYGCGFDSYEHFVNVFKGITGVTPSEYRRSQKNRCK